eukprot:TRINITY_DN48887_c0_g1_i1.p1 TRINITY_DN48887_c0_g1~~TRINITY_DN48887_c0_g1_i1.p1  ORF type:complete len:160 (+),score=11.70 TRINITY_DN48887_c0_g1_i1:124-603(+)
MGCCCSKRSDDGDFAVYNIATGELLTGEAAQQWLEKERLLQEEHGDSLIFHVYRANLTADNRKDLQGPRLLELKVAGGEVSGDETVQQVTDKLRESISAELEVTDDDNILLFLDSKPMRPESLFYADHPLALPCWIQVLLYRCSLEEYAEICSKLPKPQ